MVKGASPLTMSVAGTEPTPMKTRNAVPMTSVASFCGWTVRSCGSPEAITVAVRSHTTAVPGISNIIR